MKTIILILSFILNIVLLILLFHIRKVYHQMMKKSLRKENLKNELVEAVSYDTPDTCNEQDKAILKALQLSLDRDKLYLNPNLSLQDMAKVVGTNKTKLSSVINNNLKQNFASLLNQYRIREAINLLSDSRYFDYKIEAVGEMCGYNNRQVFHAAFKKIMGITPTHFRNISKSGNQKGLHHPFQRPNNESNE